MSDFSDEITTSGVGWHNLLDLMQDAGYEGGAKLLFCFLGEEASAACRLKTGHDSNTVAPVLASEGVTFSNRDISLWSLDAARCWIYTPGANAFSIISNSPAGY